MPIAITIISIVPDGGWMWVKPCPTGQFTVTTSSQYQTYITWRDNFINWYNYNSASAQFNKTITYYYLVFN